MMESYDVFVAGGGMSSSAVARFAAQAILESDRKGTTALEEYGKLAKTITTQTKKNQELEIDRFETNEELKKYVKSTMFTTGVKMVYQSFLNKFRPIEKLRLLPPE
jgi:hypothetical protein